jgi:GntR family transcriptional repressor for pyruvate dehydrogenase complex
VDESAFLSTSRPGSEGELLAGATLSSRVARILREKIVANELEEGTRLPTEQAMSRHFGVSRTVIREAMASLKRDGLVETRQGSGSFVRKPVRELNFQFDAEIEQSVHAVLHLIELRRSIESEVAALAAQRRNAQQLEQIRAAFDAFRQALETGGDGIAEDVIFHLSIARATGNPYWVRLIDSYANQIAPGTRVTRASEAKRKDYAQQLLSEHHAIVSAIDKGDADEARMSAIRHMDRAALCITEADRDFWRGEGGLFARALQQDSPKLE